VVDILIVLVLIVALLAGILRGFVATAGTIAGIVAGAVGALLLVPLLGRVIPVAEWRGAALAAAAVGIVVLGGVAGSAVGRALRRGVERSKLRILDRGLGAVLNVLAATVVLLLVSASVTAAGIPGLSSAVASSRVLDLIDRITPPAVDQAVAQLRSLVIDEGIPRVGEQLAELIGPTVAPTAPAVALDDPELQAAAASVARISGTAYACGVSVTGSGFVAEDGLVITNAHVVAGVDAPLVQLPGGAARDARVVYFDPVDDLAALAVEGLDAAPLPTVETLAAGSAAVVQGYPLGGPFTSTPAHVLSAGVVPVLDIYEESATPREIFALQAAVQPGNSGGPLLTADGQVAGVVFARGDDGSGRGFAMTNAELLPVLDRVSSADDAVSTGRCLG